MGMSGERWESRPAAATRKLGPGRAVGYTRVSSGRQQGDGDLDRWVGRLRAWAGGELSVITDVASGLSERRAGLRKVLGHCMTPGADRLIVEHPDRLACFGAGVIEQLLAKTKRLRVVVCAETTGGGP